MSTRRTWWIRAMAVATGLALLVGVELVLRVAGIAGGQTWAPPQLIQIVRNGRVEGEFRAASGAHFAPETQADGSTLIRTTAAFRTGKAQGYPHSGSMRDVIFTPEPAPGTERWFVLGGSAALGLNPVGPKVRATWPVEKLGNNVAALPESMAISGRLQELLTAQGRRVEVLNAGAIAQDSSSVRVIASELLGYKPGVLVLYLGNNEGIGLAWAMKGLTVPEVEPIRGALRHSRIYRVVASTIIEARQPTTPQAAPQQPAPQQASRNDSLGRITFAQWRTAGRPLMDGDEPSDDIYAAILARFETNLRGTVQAANAAGIRVIVVPTPPNLTYEPFYSAGDPGLSRAAEDELAQTMERCRAALDAGNTDAAQQAARQAISSDPANAMGHYRLGLALELGGSHDEAVGALTSALMRDISRKRTQPVFNTIAARVCQELGCTALDAHADLSTQARSGGLAVYDRMLGDHEHLNPEGNRWVAQLIAAHEAR